MTAANNVTQTEYLFIDAWYSLEQEHTVVSISRTWRQTATIHRYNPTKASIARLVRWVKESGATVRPWNFYIGWAATLAIEPMEQEATDG